MMKTQTTDRKPKLTVMSSLLTITQAAAKLNTTTRTVRRWCESGQLQASKFGRAWMIDSDALDTFEPPKRGRPVKKESDNDMPHL